MRRSVLALGVIGLSVIALTPSSWAMDPPEFILMWGTYGTGGGQFNIPAGISVDVSGNVYISEYANHRIQKFSNTGEWITMWGSWGSGNGQFMRPHGIGVDINCNVYVADQSNHRIQKFSTDGSYLTSWGTFGYGDGQFYNPTCVAVDASGFVYVVDESNNRIQKFTDTGVFVTAWGSLGTGDGQFKTPKCVAMGAGDVVYVCEESGDRVQKFSNTGTFLMKWGTIGSGNGEFNKPYGVVESPGGIVYVADTFNHRIQAFTRDGMFILTWGSFGSGAGEFHYPTRLATDDNGSIYVIDQNNSRVQKFKEVALISFDIHPRSCPNPFNIQWLENIDKGKGNDNSKTKKGGVMPTAIAGSGYFDVTDINISSIRLENVISIKTAYEDVTEPVSSSEPCACNAGGPDGFMDLIIKFSRQEIAAAIGPVEVQDEVELTLSGEMLDGTPFEVSDCVTIVGNRNDLPSFDSSDEVILHPGVPNPFNPVTRIRYYLPREEFVKLSIYDVTGKRIDDLVERVQSAGDHVIEWNAYHQASGIYFYRIEVGEFTDTQKLILLK
jgi:hypothetical protein